MNLQYAEMYRPGSTSCPPPSTLYLRMQSVLNRTPDWTTLLMSDDTGQIPVFVSGAALNLSSTMMDKEECVLLINRSGSMQLVGGPNGEPAIAVHRPTDILVGRKAYDEFKNLSGQDEILEASEYAEAVTECEVVEQAVNELNQQIEPAASEIEEAPGREPIVVPTQAAKGLLQRLPKHLAGDAALLLDCMETSNVIVNEFVRRHPAHISMRNTITIEKLGVTLYIEQNKKNKR